METFLCSVIASRQERVFQEMRIPTEQTQAVPIDEERAISRLLLQGSSPAVLVSGLCGVGKTTALHALLARTDLNARFSSGVCILPLGGIAPDELVESLLDMVRDSLSRRKFATLQSLMRNSYTRARGLETFVSAVADIPILILFDDVYAESDCGAIAAKMITSLPKVTDTRLRFVATTHASTFLCDSPSLDRVVINPSREIRIRMLCHHAGISAVSFPDSAAFAGSTALADTCTRRAKTAFERVVGACDGLPLYLMLAGRAICDLKRQCACINDVWEMYASRLGRAGGTGTRTPLTAVNLQAAVSLNAKLAEESLSHLPGNDYLQALCVLPHTRQIPRIALECAWGLDPDATEEALAAFTRFGLVAADGQSGTGVRIHEAIHQACAAEGAKLGESYLRDAHGRLVDNYYARVEVPHKEDEERQWWAPLRHDAAGDDADYLSGNLVRHLAGSGRIKETLAVLCEYRWTEARVRQSASRMCVDGLVRDIDAYVQSLPKFSAVDYCETSETIEEIREGMGHVREAVRRAGGIVGAGEAELAYQLYGRLAHRKERSAVVKRYLWSVDRRAEALRRKEKTLVQV